MSTGGKVTKMNKEKTAKVVPSSQNGKVEPTQANIRNQVFVLFAVAHETPDFLCGFGHLITKIRKIKICIYVDG